MVTKPSILTAIKVTEKLSTYELGCLIGWLKMWLEDTPAHHTTVDNFTGWLTLERKRWQISMDYEKEEENGQAQAATETEAA